MRTIETISSNRSPRRILAMAFGAGVLASGVGIALSASMPLGGAYADAAITASQTRTTAKTDRVALSDMDIACNGQAWGAQNEQCLATIAKASGTAPRQVRMIRAVGVASTVPDIF